MHEIVPQPGYMVHIKSVKSEMLPPETLFSNDVRIWKSLKVEHVNTKLFLNFTAESEIHESYKTTVLEIEVIASKLG